SDPKGKKHAIDPPLNKGEQDNAGDMDIDELDPLQPSAIKSIQDLDLEEIIGGVGQGCPAKKNTLNVLHLLQALGQTKAIEVLRSHPGLLNLGLSDTFWPVHKIMSTLTTHPGADANINSELLCTQCNSANAHCETGSGTSTCCLAFQTSAIFDLRILSFCIQQQISLLHVQEEFVKSSLCHCQELLQASCTDPHVILKYLFWHNPNFAPLEEQLNILCTSLGWIARDMGVPDSYKFKVVCPVDLFFASLSNIQVILKGTNFDITGLKSGLYMIVDNKVVMVDGSEALHFEGHTIENEAGPSNSISLLSLV
ncbi:hypothetical protein Moror_3528, partial [Moniliophthora roreri MCA 2997]